MRAKEVKQYFSIWRASAARQGQEAYYNPGSILLFIETRMSVASARGAICISLSNATTEELIAWRERLVRAIAYRYFAVWLKQLGPSNFHPLFEDSGKFFLWPKQCAEAVKICADGTTFIFDEVRRLLHARERLFPADLTWLVSTSFSSSGPQCGYRTWKDWSERGEIIL